MSLNSAPEQMAAEPLAALLKRLRGRAKLSQEELAARAGLSPRTVSDIERGVQLHPRQVTLEILSDALGIDATQRRELWATASSSGIEPIPALAGGLLGRDHVTAELCAAFAQSGRAFVTVTGAPGVGKTVLARSVAALLGSHFPGGVAFVALEDIREPGDFLAMVARALAMPERDRGAELRAEVVERLRLAPMLLVLDNIEHVVRCGPLVADLVAVVPTLSVLATGTRAFNLSVEREIVLAPLPVEEACVLFVERGGDAFAPDGPSAEDLEAIACICTALEGLPLAIELAAMRLRSLTAAQIADHLWELLEQGPQDFPVRHQALEAAIGWSYSLLDETERDAFVRFAVFAGGASLEAAEKVCPMTAKQVDALVRQSLLVAEGSGMHRRLRMLGPIREFAVARLHGNGIEEELRERHAAYFTEYAKSLNLRSRDTLKPTLVRFDAERQNFSRAWEWICAHDRWDLGIDLVCALAFLFDFRHALEESARWFSVAIERSRGVVEPEARWLLLVRASSPFQSLNDLASAEAIARELLDLAESLGPRGRVAAASERLGALRVDAADLQGARELFERALPYAEEMRPYMQVYALYCNYGLVHAIMQNYDEAARFYEKSLVEAEAAGNDLVRAIIEQNIAELYLETGDLDAAEYWTRRVGDLADELDYWEASAGIQVAVARLALARGDAETARKSLAFALEYFTSVAQPLPLLETLKEIEYYLARTGRARESVMVRAMSAKRPTSSLRMLPRMRERLEVAAREAAASLDPRDLEHAARFGERLTLDDVLAMLYGQQSDGKLHPTEGKTPPGV